MLRKVSDSLSDVRRDPDQAQKLLPVNEDDDSSCLDHPRHYDSDGSKDSVINNITTVDKAGTKPSLITNKKKQKRKKEKKNRSCFSKICTFVMGIEWIAYIYAVYVLVPDSVTYRLMTIIYQSTTIIICLEFLIEYALVLRNAAIMNEQRRIRKNRLPTRKQKTKKKNKSDSSKDKNPMVVVGYLFKTGLTGILGLNGDLVSFASIIGMLYYLYNGTIYLLITMNNTSNDIDMTNSKRIIYTIFNFLCAFGLILVNICTNLIEKMKLLYKHRSKANNPSYYISDSDHRQIDATFVNGVVFRAWTAMMLFMSLSDAADEIVTDANGLLYEVAIVYSHSKSSLSFYVYFIVLRPFGMIIIIDTILSSLAFKYRARLWFSSFDTFLTPISLVFGAYIFLMVADNHIVMTYFYIVVCAVMTVVQCYILRLWAALKETEPLCGYRSYASKFHANAFFGCGCLTAIMGCVVVLSVFEDGSVETILIRLAPMIAISWFNFMQSVIIYQLFTISRVASFVQLSLDISCLIKQN